MASTQVKIESLPQDLEIQLALSALPRHLRDNATVHILNPLKGSKSPAQVISQRAWTKPESFWWDSRKIFGNCRTHNSLGMRPCWPALWLESCLTKSATFASRHCLTVSSSHVRFIIRL
jgi:hypothetical protein